MTNIETAKLTQLFLHTSHITVKRLLIGGVNVLFYIKMKSHVTNFGLPLGYWL